MSTPSPLTQLYHLHRKRAVAIAKRLLGNADDAEDVVQDVFARLYVKGFSFDGAAAETTWLHRVMVNGSINDLRKRRRRRRLFLEGSQPLTPEDEAIGHELERHLDAALRQLPTHQHQLIDLRDRRGLSYADISRVTGLPEGTVKSGLSRGRDRLQANLAPVLDGP